MEVGLWLLRQVAALDAAERHASWVTSGGEPNDNPHHLVRTAERPQWHVATSLPTLQRLIGRVARRWLLRAPLSSRRTLALRAATSFPSSSRLAG